MLRLLHAAFGLLWLVPVLSRTGFRTKGPYWDWRMETALGKSGTPPRGEGLKANLNYLAWVHRMRRLG
ncbi:MAG: hypothetical protein AAGB51_08280 [Planctomycetota bacterium]